MRDDDEVDVLGEALPVLVRRRLRGRDGLWHGAGGDVGEVWESAVVVVAHVHAAVEHDVLAAHGDEQTGPAHVLAGAQGGHRDGR